MYLIFRIDKVYLEIGPPNREINLKRTDAKLITVLDVYRSELDLIYEDTDTR